MNEKELNNLINNDKYQVFIFTSPAHIPFSFAIHPWLVINRKGIMDRFAVAHHKNSQPTEMFKNLKDQASFGYLHKNFLPPWHGISIFSFSSKIFWRAKLVSYIEGSEGSLAQRMTDFINNSGENYVYKEKYQLWGPNSNTYVQWVLNNFPELKIKLPWNAFGKNFKKKITYEFPTN